MDKNTSQEMIIYQTDDGAVKIDVEWLTYRLADV